MLVNLHLHTTASDGTLTPAELLNEAVGTGIGIIAITDHDTCAGALEARALLRAYPGLTLISGVEISAGFDVEVHILGYGVDLDSPALNKLFDDMHQIRVERHHAIVQKLLTLGIRINDMPMGENPGRLRIAHELVRRGIAPDVRSAMRAYLIEGGAAYVPREKPAPSAAIRTIREAGGVAVLAHPAKFIGDRPSAAAWALFRTLIDCGLGGLECYHSACPPEIARRLRVIAEREGLLVTGGSDFHGANKQGVGLLSGLETWRDAEACVQCLTKKYHSIK